MRSTLMRSMIVALCGLALACKKDPPVVPEATLTLTAVDASCTEVWLKLTSTQLPATVCLLRDGNRVSVSRLISPDSMLIDEGLLPSRTYTYQLQKLANDSSVLETSTSVQLRTMDTTSHNFTWRIDTLGTHSSVLYDVAIINDTLAYAVGEIFHRDSSENWTFFNIAKWNGRQWTLHRLYYQGNIQHLRWILAFSENDIWVNPILHWNGVQWQQLPFDPIFSGVTTTKAWGTSSSDFYAVGYNGFIAHYNGSPNGAGTWRRIESGTTGNLVDVWGYTDPSNRNAVVFTVGGTSTDVRILSLSPVSAHDTLSWSSKRSIGSIWTVSRFRTYVAGVGIWRYRGPSWQQMEGGPPSVFF